MDNLIGASPGSLDQLQEIVAYADSLDSDQAVTFNALIAAVVADVQQLRDEMDELLNN